MRLPTILAGASLVAVAAVAATGAWAQPLPAGEIRARSTGGEFRGFGSTPRGPLEDVIWRLRPDGTVSSTSQIRRRYPMTSQFEEYSDIGNWRIEGDQLCVVFGGAHRLFSGCYSADGRGGDHVRLSGPVNLEGTLGH